MRTPATITSFALLAGLTLLLFLLGAGRAMASGETWPSAILLLTLASLVAGCLREAGQLRNAFPSMQGKARLKTDLGDAFAVIGGALLTFYLSRDLGLGPVTGAGLTGLAAALFLRRFEIPVYCGAFVGMASNQLFCFWPVLLPASLVAAIVFVFSRDLFSGFGGKLGTIALIGCVFSTLFSGRSFINGEVPDWSEGGLLLTYSVLAAVLAFVVSVRLRYSNVFGSALTGLISGVVLPAVYPANGEMLALMAICASFAGMSGRQRLANEAQMAAAGAICFIVFMFTAPYMGGTGGKLGTIAFGSVIAVSAVSDWTRIIGERLTRK